MGEECGQNICALTVQTNQSVAGKASSDFFNSHWEIRMAELARQPPSTHTSGVKARLEGRTEKKSDSICECQTAKPRTSLMSSSMPDSSSALTASALLYRAAVLRGVSPCKRGVWKDAWYGVYRKDWRCDSLRRGHSQKYFGLQPPAVKGIWIGLCFRWGYHTSATDKQQARHSFLSHVNSTNNSGCSHWFELSTFLKLNWNVSMLRMHVY